MKEIYILLTKTNTTLSRAIGYVTKDPFTHASLSLNQEMTELYSFGRIYKNNPFRAGFIKENLCTSIYEDNQNCNCAVYKIEVTDEQYRSIEQRIVEMLKQQGELKYNFLGLFYLLFGFQVKRKNKYFCSEFVASILKESEVLNKEVIAEKTKPSDFIYFKGFQHIFTGRLQTVAKSIV